MLPVPSHQFAQRADQLIVSDTVHVHLLLLVLQTLESSEVRVRHGLDEPVAGERLLVGVRRPEALLAVRHLARHARLHGVLRRVLLAELALDGLGRRAGAAGRHDGDEGGGGGVGADGHQRQPVPVVLAGGVGPAGRRRGQQRQAGGGAGGGALHAVDDVLQGDVPLESLQAALRAQRDDIAARGALEGADAADGPRCIILKDGVL